MNQEALLALTRARVALIIEQPFFGNLALRLNFTEDPSRRTLAVDGKKIYYNPEFVLKKLDNDLRKSALAHEIMHCVLDHIGRLQGRNHAKWNQATDFAINWILKTSGFKIGDDWLLDKKYADMSADHIYTLLPDPPPQQGGSGGSGPDGGKGGLCDVLPSEDPAKDPASAGKAKHDALDWQIATAQAAQQARIQGKLPASIERLVGEVLGGKVDWRSALWRFADEVCKADYSWQRPNRRYMQFGMYAPSLYSHAIGTAVVFVDTSGSIDGPILDAFLAELRAVKEAVRPKQLYIISADAAVQRVDVFEEDDEIVFKPKGGGGTDFRPAFEYIEKEGITPTFALYLTDMYGSFPTQEPEYPVLWCATTREKAPWGETVRIEI